MIVLFALVVCGWVGWLLTRHIVRFPIEFARLLDRAERRSGLGSLFGGRSRGTGEYQGRPVELLFQWPSEPQPGSATVSMRAVAPDQDPIRLHPRNGSGVADRELERALFALEGKHGLVLAVADGWLHATWQPVGFFIFPGRFDGARWREILAGLSVVAARLERDTRGPSRWDADPGGRV